jgi:transcription initiation factor TFIID subunit TAF12
MNACPTFLQIFLQVREGQRSVLKKICEQDLPSRVPVVLVVSAIRTRDFNTKQQQQQQQDEQQQQALGGGRSSRSSSPEAAAAAGGGEVQSIQLSDGWYALNASLDGPLTELVAAGRIQVGYSYVSLISIMSTEE